MFKEAIIEYTEPKEYSINPDLFPPVTHARISNIILEISRPADGKEGWMEIWLSPGYFAPVGVFNEAPGFAGEHIRLEEIEMLEWSALVCNQEAVVLEYTRTICEYLISTGYVSGSVEILEINGGE